MKHFWALPVFLRIAIASSRHFNVYEDLHAHPQYEIVYSKGVITEQLAQSLLSEHRASHTPTHPTEPQSSDVPAIRHSSNDQPYTPDDDRGKSDQIAGYEEMILKGQKYLCSLPRIPETEAKPEPNITAEQAKKEILDATERGWNLLQGMQGQCIYFVSGWWSYSFCFNEGVKQFHQLPPARNVPAYPPVEDKNVGSYMLGRFKSEANQHGPDGRDQDLDDDEGSMPARPRVEEKGLALPKLQTKGEASYLTQTLQGGTLCDLTNKPRKIEVQFHCEAAAAVDRISLIKETATCQYLMIISTPRLCNDVAFRPAEEKAPNPIICTKVLPTGTDMPSYLAAQEETDERTMDDRLEELMTRVIEGVSEGTQIRLDDDVAQIQAALNKKLFVGDIEVGGNHVVPRGKQIESSVIAGGGKETFVATIAKSDGFIMSDAELRKLNMQGQVQAVKSEMERVSKGKDWRLDVVETARGKELRGIIETGQSDDSGRQGEGKAAESAEQQDGEAAEAGEEDAYEDGSEETYKEEL